MCERACYPKLGIMRYDSWCKECKDDYLLFVDEQADMAILEKYARLAMDANPATDGEWRRRLDEIAPLDGKNTEDRNAISSEHLEG